MPFRSSIRQSVGSIDEAPVKTRYFFIEGGDPQEAAGWVDFDALVRRVVELLEADPDATLAPLVREDCRIKVVPGSVIEDLSRRAGTTTGLEGGCVSMGLSFPPDVILVPRLDYKGLLAHEMGHIVLHLLGRKQSESTCRWLEDQV